MPVLPEEPPTLKRKAISDSDKCPFCGGTGLLDFEAIEGGGSNSKFGIYRFKRCECKSFDDDSK